MQSLPKIYTIQASDAPQHTDRLRKILQGMKTEKRISGYTVFNLDDDLSTLSHLVREKDMILIPLTNQIKPKIDEIGKIVRELISRKSGLRVAEVLVDNMVYDNDFITFPADLRPIRNREDMDSAWDGIAKSLNNMFPQKEEKESKSIPQWIVFTVLGILLFGGLMIYLMSVASGDEAHEIVTTVPDVIGVDVEEAVSSLRDAGLQIGERQTESNDTFGENLVIRTDPPTGISVDHGASINLFISLGPAPVEVPDVIGENVVNAILALQDVGLQIGERQTEPHNTFDENLIVSTNPPAGELVKQESRISLIISTGPLRIIEIIGTDDMKFRVTEDAEGLVTAGQVGEEFELSQILASPGERLRIILYTRSRLPAAAMSHNFSLLDLGTDIDQFARESIMAADNEYIAPAFEDQVIVATAILGGGESETIEFNAPDQPGRYEFVCTFPGHFAAAMGGQLIVQ